MDNLPTTLQAMKDYVRYAKSAIKKETKRIEDLEQAIIILEPKILIIEDQLKEHEHGNMERGIRGELPSLSQREV